MNQWSPSVAVWVALLCGCSSPPPDNAAMESLGILASQAQQPEAQATLRGWAEHGNAVAQRELGVALLSTPGQSPEAIGLLERAALNGDAEAGFVLGDAWRLGRFGLQADAANARIWFERGARQGHADAALALARMARNGDAGARDDAAALHWLQTASERGNPQAMFLLSNAYAQGLGTPVVLDLARKWLEASADKHFPPAIQAYALALEDGALGFEPDRVAAAELMHEAEEERLNRWNMR